MMMSSDKIKKAVEALGICHDLMVFNPSTGEDIDPFFLNEDDRALYDGIENILQYIKQLEAQVPRWIPVTERLPSVAGKYLTMVNCEKGEWCEINRYEPEEKDWVHEFSDSGYTEDATPWVTQWMPLPSAPEEVSE